MTELIVSTARLRELSTAHADVTTALKGLTSATLPSSAELSSTYGTIASSFTQALDATFGTRGESLTATSDNGEAITNKLEFAATG